MTASAELLTQAIGDGAPAENMIVSAITLDGGWSTRTLPHLLPANRLAVADNVEYYRDGLISKRPGNVLYGSVGTNEPIAAMCRFYFGSPIAGQLVVHSDTQLARGNDLNGHFTQITNELSSRYPACFAQMYDPDNGAGATTLFVCDGVHAPGMWDGQRWRGVNTTAGYLPQGLTLAPITPRYCAVWGEHLVYANDPTEPTGLYISDAYRPERFTGFALTDSGGTNYTAYFPGGRNAQMGEITGLQVLGPYLLVFFTAGIVSVFNTGTYGAFQYQFYTLAASVGAIAPQSIVPFDTFVVFFGGDKFYATDGQTVVSLPNEIPTVYNNNARSVHPPEITNPATVVGARRGLRYWASYDNDNDSRLECMVVFNMEAAGGWQYGAPTGGAWSRWPTGMDVQSAIECRGPGDTRQMFWGSSENDQVFIHDAGTYSDNGAPIAIEIRAKSYFLDRPLNIKTVQGMYILCDLDVLAHEYTDTLQPYVIFDQSLSAASAVALKVAQLPPFWGSVVWGAFAWTAEQVISQQSPKTYLAGQMPQGLSVSPGLIESSDHPFGVFGFALELTQEAAPTP